MDIGQLSMSLSQSNLMQNVSIGVLKMATDSAQQQGQMLTQMIERSATPNLGGNLDIRV